MEIWKLSTSNRKRFAESIGVSPEWLPNPLFMVKFRGDSGYGSSPAAALIDLQQSIMEMGYANSLIAEKMAPNLDYCRPNVLKMCDSGSPHGSH